MLFLGQLLFFVVEVPIIALVVLCLLFYYSAKRGATSWYVYLLVGIAWFICLVVIFLVPLDLAETLVDRCQVLVSYSEYTGYQKGDCPIHETRPGFVFILWLVIYWISFALTWLFLPIFSQYAVAGDYSIGFGIYMGIRYHLSAYSLMGLLIGLSNAFGLLGVICMLGYGIVQIPRALWHRGDLSRRLRYCEFKVTEYTDRMDEARADLAQILGQIERVQQKLAHLLSATDNEGTNVEEAGISQSSFPKRHRLINFIQVIISEIPKEDLRVALPVPDRTAEIPKTITENFLAFLHQRLNQRVIEYRKSSYLWGRTCDEAFQLEQWMTWKSYYLLSCVSHVDLSPLSLWIHRQGMSNYSIQLISLFSIAYLALCVYYSLFHFNLYRFYELIPQHTDAYSLFLNALLCCRFTVPLCYNFLTLLHETSFAVPLLYPQIPASLLPTTSFSKVEQSMQVLPILGNSFNAFFPVVLLLFVLGTSFQLWTR
ncbi:LMBR1 domain-containing protein 2 [Galdieria sulphuraria]|nr:LMBR1 domain-containing protein 2 [Galdieria sulphuraria]